MNESEYDIHKLIDFIKPWVDADQLFVCELAKHDWSARLALAESLAEFGNAEEASRLLRSITESDNAVSAELKQVQVSALIALSNNQMELLLYDEAEASLWKVIERIDAIQHENVFRDDIALMISQARFGQGFVQDAIDRTEQILQDLQKTDKTRLTDEALTFHHLRITKSYQQLGWYYFHRNDIPYALEYLKKAIDLSPKVDAEMLRLGKQSESQLEYQEAVEYYFDSIVLE